MTPEALAYRLDVIEKRLDALENKKAGDDAFILARAKRILPLLPALYKASGAMDMKKTREVCDTIWQADQDAMGSYEDSHQ